ncbi:MAG: DNA translocase FtsK 4TM domain-containing protein [Alistipes sp.]|nr:DNA translocase FtsK 4TM domain-containing protein [Alistipes sp.]
MTQRARNEKKRYDKAAAAKAPASASNDNMLWMLGFVMLIFGIFSVVSVLSHYVHWASDLTALRNDVALSGVEIPFENMCSSAGARVAYWVVDCTFGVFGIIIPIVITVIGWRIFRRSRLRMNHFTLSAALVLVMGSLTLGFIGTHVGAAYDIGGALGQACATDLAGLAGAFGTILILLAGWILTGVFINRNFIRTVDKASDKMVLQSERLVSVVKERVIKNRHSDDAEADDTEEEYDDEADDEADGPQPAADPVPQRREEPRAAEPLREERRPAPEPWRDRAAAEVTPASAVKPSPSASMPSPAVTSAAPATAEPAQPRRWDAAPVLQAEEQPDYPRTELVGDEPEPQHYADDDIVLEKAAVEPERDATLESMGLPEPDEDGFIVIPNNGAVPNKIDVDALLAPEKPQPEPHHQPEPQPMRASEPEVDEDGFAVIPRTAVQADAAPQPSHLTEGAAYEADDVHADVTAHADAAAAEPRSGSAATEPAAAEDEGGIVVKVHENRIRQVGEEDMAQDLYDPLRDLENYRKPYASLLEDYRSPQKVSDAEIYDNKCRIEETLKYFGIPIIDIHATVGPTVTLYEIVQAQGVKISKIQGLEKDIAQSLKSLGIRIIAPIPGRGTIGIEVPNRDKQTVSMYSAICSEEFQSSKAELPVVIGRTIQNENYTFDLAKMPHLLVAGATGQGKSVGLNAIITSLLYRKHPAQLKFVMIDPKMVEFSVYNKLEHHFLAKMESEDEAIVTDPKKAVCVLNSLVEEMGRRLELCKMATARNIVEYNEKFVARRLNPQKGHRYLPYIVVVVDEFADLIMTAKAVEVPVMRLAQKARAVGIHLIIATQRPDVKVITGGIKANFPARIAFRVMQMIDSRTIIDQPGANQLIGRGDMLFSKDGELTRIQCALVETREVERLVDFISKQQGYPEAYALPDCGMEGEEGASGTNSGESDAPVKYDVLFGEIARAAVTNGMISTSSIQRNYEVGFNRAGRIMLQLERAGIVGPQIGAKPREIKFYDLPSLEAKLQDLGVF